MTHYLLNYLDVRFIFAKPCAKRMAKNVATEMRDDNGFSAFFLSFLFFLFVAPSCYCVDCSVNCLRGAQSALLIYKYEAAHAAYRRRRETSFLLCHCQRGFCFP